MVVGESCIILNIATEMGSLWFLFFYFFGCYVFYLFFLVFFTTTPIYLETETKQVKLLSFLMRTCFGGF